jgi:transposase
MAHGLIRPSFVPDEPTQQMRDLLRTRKQFVRERTGHTHRIQKTLEDANIKLDSVISNIVGISGRRMIEALIDGQAAPEALAALAHGRLQATPAELEASLRGRVTAHHRFMLRLHLDHLDALDAAIGRIDKEVDCNVEPFRVAIEMLTTIPGVSRLSAEVIVSEIGIDMSRFPTEGHVISWAGLCPKNDESAGKRRSTRMKKGAPWLKTTLVQCAWAATRTKETYPHAQYLRIRSRRGAKKESAPSPLPSLPSLTTCSKMAPSTKTWAQATSTTVPEVSTSCVWSSVCRTSVSPFKSPSGGIVQALFLFSKPILMSPPPSSSFLRPTTKQPITPANSRN